MRRDLGATLTSDFTLSVKILHDASVEGGGFFRQQRVGLFNADGTQGYLVQ